VSTVYPSRASCCQSRENNARVLLANDEATPESIFGATDCTNPGPGSVGSVYRNYSCLGSAPARFVYLASFCSTVGACGGPLTQLWHFNSGTLAFTPPSSSQVPCDAINPAEITVWGYAQTFPATVTRIVFNAATSLLSSALGSGSCSNTQTCAANAINGILATTDYVHTSTGAAQASFVWGMWDTGSNLTSIDHVFYAGRNSMSANCGPLWHRDKNMEVAVSNDTVSLANGSPTPASARCIASLGDATTGGNMGRGLVAPWNWYGGDCNRVGRYMWFRKTGAAAAAAAAAVPAVSAPPPVSTHLCNALFACSQLCRCDR
jgi:hypothetical protein